MWDVESGVFNKEWMKISLYLHFTKMDQNCFHGVRDHRLGAVTLSAPLKDETGASHYRQ